MAFATPFTFGLELNHDLSISTPSGEPDEFVLGPNKVLHAIKPTLVHEPLIEVHNNNVIRIQDCLKGAVLTPKINRLFPVLWMVAKPDSSHVSSLHHQLVRGREILITEDPEMHLVWYHNRVYIKPIPAYLLNYAFWEVFLTQPNIDPAVRPAALGFLRSWAYLVKSKSDFDIAVEKQLLRFDTKTDPEASFTAFVQFLDCFSKFDDEAVSPRYNYGDLRLSRLNWWTKFRLIGMHHHKTYGQYGKLLSRVVPPFLFTFAIASVALGAMQVELAVEASDRVEKTWGQMWSVSRWFSVISLLVVAISIAIIPLLGSFLLLRELWFVVRHYGWKIHW